MTYTVEIRPAAARQIKKLTKIVQEQVFQQLEELELEPRPLSVTKLSGKNNLYRVKVGLLICIGACRIFACCCGNY